MTKAGELQEGTYIRSPRSSKKIMVIKKKTPPSSVLAWEIDPATKIDKANAGMLLKWDQGVEVVSI